MAPEYFSSTWTPDRGLLKFQAFVWKNSLYIVTDYFTIFRIAVSGKLAEDKLDLNINDF